MPRGQGKSSIHRLWKEESISRLVPGGSTLRILDAGCGGGNYSRLLSRQLGPGGLILGMDLGAEVLKTAAENLKEDGTPNMALCRADLGITLPLKDGSIDLIFMATVFHDLVADGVGEQALGEASRILAPRGTIAMVEFYVLEEETGPPASIRLDPDELDGYLHRHGFRRISLDQVGDSIYLALYSRG